MSKDKDVKKKKSNGIKTILLILNALIIVYLAGVIYFGDHFFPNTYIGEYNYSFKDRADIKADVQNIPVDIKFELDASDGTIITFDSESMGMKYKADSTYMPLNTDYIESFKWPVYLVKKDNIPMMVNVDYDMSKVMTYLSRQPQFDVHKGQKSTAKIGDYNSETGEFEVITGESASRLDMKSTLQAIDSRLKGIIPEPAEFFINLEEEGCYRTDSSSDEGNDEPKGLALANKYVSSNIVYKLPGGTEEVTGDMIAGWLVTNGEAVAIDQAMIQKYVSEIAEKYNTLGKSYDFKCADGTVRNLKRLGFGWAIDVEEETKKLASDIEEGFVGEREPVYSSRGCVSDANDIGNSYVEVNMSAQHLYLWKDGAIILESDVVTGDMATGCATPMGIFSVKYKKYDTILRGRTWEDHVYYWMPFYGNYGMHDAEWRDRFGGDIFTNSGSHGCVNLPIPQAEVIFNTVTTNYPVICYY